MQHSRPSWLVLAPALALGLIAVAEPARADDWEQFGGSGRDGRAPADKELATEWPAAGPPVLWSVDVDAGYGGASVHGDEVFLAERIGNAEDVLRCFSLTTGEEKWRFTSAVPGRLNYEGSRSVPLVTANRVFMTGPFGHLYCIDRKSHAAVWTKQPLGDHGGSPPRWGYAASPLLYGDLVIAPALGAKVGVVAYRQADGEVAWRSAALGSDTYASPSLHRIGGADHLLFAAKQGRTAALTGLDPKTGATLWAFDDFKNGFPIPGPTEIAEGTFFLTAGYKSGSVVVKVEAKKDGTYVAKEAARVAGEGAQIHPAMLHDGHLYVNFNCNDNLKRNPTGLVCLGLDGEMKWKTGGTVPIERGGLLLVGDKLLALDGQDGVLRLIHPNPDRYTELASAAVLVGLDRRDNNIWAPMAFVDGKLLVRGQKQLTCLDLRKGAKAPKKRGAF